MHNVEVPPTPDPHAARATAPALRYRTASNYSNFDALVVHLCRLVYFFPRSGTTLEEGSGLCISNGIDCSQIGHAYSKIETLMIRET